jgi:hypothetical protein
MESIYLLAPNPRPFQRDCAIVGCSVRNRTESVSAAGKPGEPVDSLSLGHFPPPDQFCLPFSGEGV